MKKKTKKAIEFIEGLISEIENTKLNKGIANDKEPTNHREVDAPIEKFLEKYYSKISNDTKQIDKKVKDSLYKEFDDGNNPIELNQLFSSKAYPDFSIVKPYKIAIEYKKGDSGVTFKIGLHQCMNHILSESYDFAILIFSDFHKDKIIKKSIKHKLEKDVLKKFWDEFNIKVVFANHK